MNRPLIITIGIVFILMVLGLWVYLLLFGTPESPNDVFSNFGFEINSQETTIVPPANLPLPTTTVNTTGSALRQLTTRPVAGFTFVFSTTSPNVRYVERGTGHVYEIDLATGAETQLSRTTVAQTAEAVFSPDTNTVALTAYDGYTTSVTVGTISEDANLSSISLRPGAKNISFSSDKDVLYTVSVNGVTTGYRHNIETLSQTEVFSFAFSNLDVVWGDGLETVYLSTKPAAELEGYIYTTENNILEPYGPVGFGLSALFGIDRDILTYADNGIYQSVTMYEGERYASIPILALKEKCVFDSFSPNLLWCAAPVGGNTPGFVEDWYKGTTASDDLLWLVDTADETAGLYADFEELSGRTIDVSRIEMNNLGNALSFTNKHDHTLWFYDLTIE